MKTNRLLITSIVALLGLSACTPAKSASGKDSTPTSGGGDIDAPTEITIWTTY